MEKKQSRGYRTSQQSCSWGNAHGTHGQSIQPKREREKSERVKEREIFKTKAGLLNSLTHTASAPADRYQLLPFLYKKQTLGKNGAVKEVTKSRQEKDGSYTFNQKNGN